MVWICSKGLPVKGYYQWSRKASLCVRMYRYTETLPPSLHSHATRYMHSLLHWHTFTQSSTLCFNLTYKRLVRKYFLTSSIPHSVALFWIFGGSCDCQDLCMWKHLKRNTVYLSDHHTRSPSPKVMSALHGLSRTAFFPTNNLYPSILSNTTCQLLAIKVLNQPRCSGSAANVSVHKQYS